MSANFSSSSKLKEAQALKEKHKLDQALMCLKDGLETHPQDVNLRMELVLVFGEKGERGAAVRELETLIKDHPFNPEYHRFLTFYKKYSVPEDSHIAQIIALLESPATLSSAKASLHFALGKIFEDLGIFEKSFDHYQKGNGLINQKIGFSLEKTRENFEQIKTHFDQAFFEKFKGGGLEDETPIFIVGMPRSGTSLLEQVLASHSEVYGAGELEKIWQLYTKTLGLYSENFEAGVEALTEAKIRNCAEFYLAHIRQFSQGARYITDKMPMNFRYIGLIKVMFPNARIVHCIRNPRDTCLSIFKQKFVQSVPYAYSMENIVGYYELYIDLMRHWHSVLPGGIFDVEYEGFVADQQRMTRKLLDYCDLDWEKGCLEFHKTVRAVNTASATQVKQPLYKGAVGYWKNYEPYLDDSLKFYTNS